MAINKFTELDFAQIKENLKDFLKSQSEFSDFDFDGSSISILLDLLAYNTAYNAFYANMLANESFLETSVLRQSIVSNAKMLNYTPRSKTPPKAQVTIDIYTTPGPGPASPAFITIPQWFKFTTTLNNKSYTFVTPQAYTLTNNGLNHYIANIEIEEGERLNQKFIVDRFLENKQKFILPNANINTKSIIVKVFENSSSVNFEFYSLANDVNDVNPDSLVYFLQETDDKEYELVFGDGVLGKRLENGNIVIVEYNLTNGPLLNGVRNFSLGQSIGYNSVTLTTLEAAKGGVDEESDDSIKFLAPKYYESQNRAVTKSDYETLLLKDYPQIEFLRVWGGEDNDPPMYGKIFIAAKPKNAITFTVQEKADILANIVRPRNIISLEAVMVDPEFIKIMVNTTVNYTSRKTLRSSGEIETLVRQAIQDYRDTYLIGFNTEFRYSILVQAISSADPSIVSNLTEIKLKSTITPPLNIAQRYEIAFNSEISKGDSANNISGLLSTSFLYNGFQAFLSDDGKGNIFVFRYAGASKIIMENNIGTIDYATGKVIIPSLTIEGIVGSLETVDIIVTPLDNDFASSRNEILLLEDTDVRVNVVDDNR